MLIIILFCSSLLGEPPVVTITLLSIRVQTLQSTVACPVPAELIPPARRFSPSPRPLWGQTKAWVTLNYPLQRDQPPPGTRDLSWMPTLTNYKRQLPKLNRLSASTIRMHYKQQIRLQRWYITIPSSDRWCTTIENHRYQWLSYLKTIGKPLIPMVALNQSIQWWL